MTGDNVAMDVIQPDALVLVVVDDLMFQSRIAEAARGTGVRLARVASAAQVAEHAPAAAGVLIDLDARRLPLADVLEALRSQRGAAVPVVGFYSHVDTARAAEAAGAGCQRVLPRSAFVRELPGILAGWARPSS